MKKNDYRHILCIKRKNENLSIIFLRKNLSIISGIQNSVHDNIHSLSKKNFRLTQLLLKCFPYATNLRIEPVFV